MTSSEIGGYIYSLYQNTITVEKSTFESFFSQGEGSYIINLFIYIIVNSINEM